MPGISVWLQVQGETTLSEQNWPIERGMKKPRESCQKRINFDHVIKKNKRKHQHFAFFFDKMQKID